MDYTIKIGGEAGQGLQTVGGLLARMFARMGYHVFTHQDYESRVRGGHNFYQVRVSIDRVTSSREKAEIIVALDGATLDLHRIELTEDGVMIYDPDVVKKAPRDIALLEVPFSKIAKDEGGSPVMANTVATGAVTGMLGMETGTLEALIGETFGKKGAGVVEANIKAARAGHGYARENCKRCGFKPKPPRSKENILINGTEAIAIGALVSGCKFYSAYPMTPSTGVMNNMASRASRYGVVVEQAEDEIAAINLAIGASFAGVRAMTGTSGGGFALMAEGLSLAGMTETPIVIAEGQRPGPATGLPTRTEQGDLRFVLGAGHGEFPRVVFAPGSPRQAIMLTNKAFDLAEKYQVPAFVLFDQYLGDSEWTYDRMEPEGLVYRDYRLRGKEFGAMDHYRRHAFTESGVSPLAVPGDAPMVVVTDSDEHDEDGHIIEDAQTRVRMVEKRLLKKTVAIRQEMGGPIRYGHREPDLVLVGWGSTYGVLRETVDRLTDNGRKAAMLLFTEIYPLPAGDYLDLLSGAGRTVCVEGNATGQFESLMRAETGFSFEGHIRRYDGRPFSVGYILGALDAGD